ncbi:MAG: hypothetical protein LBF24_02530 [Puniceicoccales bacterium]|jgi:hypothetical protein|nr:hypothetical protein [Puniceicoccales bacterium]
MSSANELGLFQKYHLSSTLLSQVRSALKEEYGADNITSIAPLVGAADLTEATAVLRKTGLCSDAADQLDAIAKATGLTTGQKVLYWVLAFLSLGIASLVTHIAVTRAIAASNTDGVSPELKDVVGVLTKVVRAAPSVALHLTIANVDFISVKETTFTLPGGKSVVVKDLGQFLEFAQTAAKDHGMAISPTALKKGNKDVAEFCSAMNKAIQAKFSVGGDIFSLNESKKPDDSVAERFNDTFLHTLTIDEGFSTVSSGNTAYGKGFVAHCLSACKPLSDLLTKSESSYIAKPIAIELSKTGADTDKGVSLLSALTTSGKDLFVKTGTSPCDGGSVEAIIGSMADGCVKYIRETGLYGLVSGTGVPVMPPPPSKPTVTKETTQDQFNTMLADVVGSFPISSLFARPSGLSSSAAIGDANVAGAQAVIDSLYMFRAEVVKGIGAALEAAKVDAESVKVGDAKGKKESSVAAVVEFIHSDTKLNENTSLKGLYEALDSARKKLVAAQDAAANYALPSVAKKDDAAKGKKEDPSAVKK